MENEKEIWAKIINDARFYDGTPQMLKQLTEHFMKHYKVVLPQANVIKSVCQTCGTVVEDNIVNCDRCMMIRNEH